MDTSKACLDKLLKEKYENHKVKALKTLKTSKSNFGEIKYVLCLLRKKLDANTVNKATDTADESLNHDNYVECNFWAYVKYMFDQKDLVLPTVVMNHEGEWPNTRQAWTPRIGDLSRGLSVIVHNVVHEHDIEP